MTKPSDNPTPEIENTDEVSHFVKFLVFGLSVPERVLRSTVSLTAGAAREMGEVLVPRSFQDSKTYEIVVAKSLKFLTEDIGGATPRETEEVQAQENYVARKAVGNFLDLAGLTTLHMSPVWLMAIVSDVAYGSKSYVAELGRELAKKGLIEEDSTINNVDDVLKAIRDGTGHAASMFDTPPLSIKELEASLTMTRESIQSADYRKILPLKELQGFWREMKDISKEEDVGLLEVSGAMTMHTFGRVTDVSQGVVTGVTVAGGLFNRHVIGHYVDAMKDIHKRGYYASVRDSYAPYVEGVFDNFHHQRETVTEDIVRGRWFTRFGRAIAGRFRRKPHVSDAPPE